MASCESIRPLLFKMAEREVSPREAMRTASHLAGCTACKILLARERRLARMLEVDLQDIPVGEDFFQSVMDSIPEDPPPAQAEEQKRKSRNGMKLAGFAGLIGAGALLLSRMTLLQGSPGFMSALPSTDLDTANGSPLLTGNLDILGGAAAAVLLLLGAGSALFALVARCWFWPSR
jgi:anti-sigma factor RsiW